ncbi:MAG: Eco57I restriction-modification methylase domain-containing protein [Armatimonadetes bacterium]|nr:Eco57I restriction-modification methylase domain-containing protein [Armatimonadota bacterium]
MNRTLKMFHERALPDLGSNIKCGNSLIGPDFYDNQQMSFLDDDEQYRINVFDWNAGFPEVMKSGGFDAVIGNPPYIFTRNERISQVEKSYFCRHYWYQFVQLNTFSIFVERCHALLRQRGVLGFITPNNWLTIDSFSRLRQFLLNETGELQVVNILDRVFSAAHVDTAILLFGKTKPSGITVAEMRDGRVGFTNWSDGNAIGGPSYIISIGLLMDDSSRGLLRRIGSETQPLASFCVVSTGLKVYQTGKGKPAQTDQQKMTRSFHSRNRNDESYGLYLSGADVCRYRLSWSGEYLSYGEWIAEPRRSVPFDGPRLLVRQIPGQRPYLIHAVLTDEPSYNDINSMVIFAPKDDISLKYILALINSRLLSFWFLKTFDKLQRKIFPQFKVRELASFPIRCLNPCDPFDKARHDRIVQSVDWMLALHKQLAGAKSPPDKESLQHRIDATDRQIDRLVYELYGLTEEEIGIVEGEAREQHD